MLQNIFNIIEVVKGETENIRIAQGKNYLPNTFKETFTKIKQEAQWHKDTQ
jgi:hypothetical protein